MDTARILSGKCLSEAWGLLRGRGGGGAGLCSQGPRCLVSKHCSWILEGQEEGEGIGPAGHEEVRSLAISDLSGRKSAYVFSCDLHSMYQKSGAKGQRDRAARIPLDYSG